MTDISDAANQAHAKFESIKELVGNLRAGHENDNAHEIEEAKARIHKDALSIEVRSDWYAPSDTRVPQPAEYRILLCTGEPAVQIIGDLSPHNEPESARLQHQDWFKPWTDWNGNCAAVENFLLEYVRCFYFGD